MNSLITDYCRKTYNMTMTQAFFNHLENDPILDLLCDAKNEALFERDPALRSRLELHKFLNKQSLEATKQYPKHVGKIYYSDFLEQNLIPSKLKAAIQRSLNHTFTSYVVISFKDSQQDEPSVRKISSERLIVEKQYFVMIQKKDENNVSFVSCKVRFDCHIHDIGIVVGLPIKLNSRTGLESFFNL